MYWENFSYTEMIDMNWQVIGSSKEVTSLGFPM